MEKPAAIFSEAGFKILIEALTNKTFPTDDDGVSSSAVDKFLQGWEMSKVDKQPGRTPRNYEAEAAALKEIMLDNGPMKLNDIYIAMKEQGLWNIEPKQANQRLKLVTDRTGCSIERVERGLYEMRAGHE